MPSVAQMLSVKNTFVHYDEGSDPDSDLYVQPRVLRSKSTPAKVRPVQDACSTPEVKHSQDIDSIGSLAHASGSCRPCAWFWKPEGCANGKECRHCHACPQGEGRRRKKERAKGIQREKLERKLSDFQETTEKPLRTPLDRNAKEWQPQAVSMSESPTQMHTIAECGVDSKTSLRTPLDRNAKLWQAAWACAPWASV
jgi:transposase-like protein